MNPKTLLCVVSFMTMASLGHFARSADVTSTWDGSTNNWSDSSHWDSLLFPNNGNGGLTYDAVISSGTVTLDQAISIEGLNQTGGIVDGTSDLTANGLTTWMGGEMTGTGTTHANGGLVLSAATKFLTNGRTINNAGAATWTAGPFTTSSGAVFNNQLGATFDTNFDGTFANGFGAQSQFNNTGTFTKSGGTGTTPLSVIFNNSGIVQVESGTLMLSQGGISIGSFTGAAGTTFDFRGTHDLNTGSSVSSAGTVQISAGTWNLNDGSYNVTGTTAITGGTVNFNTPGNTNLLNLSGGVLSGSSDITASGLITWSALSGAGGEMTGTGTTHANGGLVLSGATKFLTNGRTINNAGAATWTAGPFTTSSGAVFNNQLGATFDTNFDGTFANGAGAQSQFNNTGTFTKSGGAGATSLSIEFNNTGSVDVQSGTLDLGGNFTNFTSATNTLTGGTYHVSATLKFQSAGINTNQAAITLDGPAAQIVDGSDVDALANLSLNDVGAAFAVTGGKHFTTSAAYTNSGTATVNGSSTFTADAFLNAATGTLSGTGTVEIAGAGQVLTNHGVVAPGSSAGTLNVTGDYTQGPLGTLQIEIGGLAAGSEFDQLLVSGTATLAGALDVSIIGGFAPEFGDAFVVLDAGSLSNEFTGLAEGATLSADGVEFGVTYLSDGGSAVDLTVTGFTLPADFNFDGQVDALDLGIWQTGYGSGSLHSQGDANGDGQVNGNDFLAWQRQAGRSLSPPAESTAVPEPSSLLLVAMSVVWTVIQGRNGKVVDP